MRAVFSEYYQKKQSDYQILKEKLAVLSPLNTLERGYSICLKEGKTLRHSKAVVPGDKVTVQLNQGHLICQVTEEREGSVYEKD